MTSLSIGRCCQASWEDVRTRVNKAVVFVDSASAECLHWAGGGMMLVNAGAVNIKEFSSFESAGPNERKAVFILSAPLTGMTVDILQDIIRASSFQYVIIVSTLSPAMHTLVRFGLTDDTMKAFHQVEEDALEWMGNMNYTAEVVYVPAAAAPITPLLFVMPQHSQLFPLLPTDIQHLQEVHQKDGMESFNVDFTHLGREAQLQLKLLVCSLNSLFEQLSVSEDCYALGATSKIVATELASLSWAKARRKAAKNKASILLVDRSLDVASAVSHQTETLLEKILMLLPRLSGHQNDVQVNMTPLCSVPSDCDESVIVPGCLAHSVDGPTTQLLHKMSTSKHKEALMEMNRQLVEAASASSLPLKLDGKPGRVTADQLLSTATLFKGRASVVRRHSGLLQLVMATVQALNHPGNSKLDSLLGVEKGLVSCFGEENGSALLGQLIQTVNRDLERPPSERLYSLEDIFLFLTFIYSVFESEDLHDIQQEKILQAALVGAALEEEPENLPDFLQEMLGPKYREDRVRQVLEEIFMKLKGLASARENIEQFRSVAESGGLTSPSSLKPLLKQLVEAIFHPDKPELSDIVYKSTGLRDLIKSGFGLFMKVSKPRPSDQPLLVIFVIGGVTATEVKQVKEALAASKTNMQVIIGSTCLLRPKDILHRVLAQDNLRPLCDSI